MSGSLFGSAGAGGLCPEGE